MNRNVRDELLLMGYSEDETDDIINMFNRAGTIFSDMVEALINLMRSVVSDPEFLDFIDTIRELQEIDYSKEPEILYLVGTNDIHKYYMKNHLINTKGYYSNRFIRQKRFKRHNRGLPIPTPLL